MLVRSHESLADFSFGEYLRWLCWNSYSTPLYTSPPVSSLQPREGTQCKSQISGQIQNVAYPELSTAAIIQFQDVSLNVRSWWRLPCHSDTVVLSTALLGDYGWWIRSWSKTVIVRLQDPTVNDQLVCIALYIGVVNMCTINFNIMILFLYFATLSVVRLQDESSRRSQYPQKNPSKCHFVHHKWKIDVLVSNLGLCGEKPVTCTRNGEKTNYEILPNTC